MKKSLLFTTLAAATILGGLGSLPVAAATGDTATSNATIKFTENEDKTTPIEPGDKDKPTDMKGPLSLDLVPGLDFGSHLTKQENTFTDGDTHKIQVTDGRSNNTGWNVTAQISDFKGAATNSTLTGAKLSAGAGTVQGAVNGALDPTIATTGVHSLAVTDLDSASGAANIFSGDADKSAGTWQAQYDADAFKLDVPVTSQAADTYTATITWTINDGPAK
ncbi:MAG: WxL domain-containing protein [Lactobacillus sp.]|nr:WxL domain-containing protein [Lactobacillus sp.]